LAKVFTQGIPSSSMTTTLNKRITQRPVSRRARTSVQPWCGLDRFAAMIAMDASPNVGSVGNGGYGFERHTQLACAIRERLRM
jgi:hypothetical protein